MKPTSRSFLSIRGFVLLALLALAAVLAPQMPPVTAAPTLPAASSQSVGVNTNGVIVSPTNFIPTNQIVTVPYAATNYAPSAAGYTTLTAPASNSTNTIAVAGLSSASEAITLPAGSGPYTNSVVIQDTGATTNKTVEVNVAWPTTTNATLAVYDNAVSGSPILSPKTSTLQGGNSTFEFHWTGSGWKEFPKGEVPSRLIPFATYMAMQTQLNAPQGLLTSNTRVFTPEQYGGAPDGISISNAVLTASSTTITSSTAAFVTGAVNNVNGVNSGGDVGKAVLYYNGPFTDLVGITTTAGSPTLTMASTSGITVGQKVRQLLYAVTTGTWTSTGTAMTVASGSYIVPGMRVYGAGLTGLTVSAVSGTTVTLSANPSFTVSSASAVDFYLENIPVGTTVTTVNSGTTVTLSANAIATASTAARVFFRPQPVRATITAVNSATSISVSVAPTVSASGCYFTYGTDNTTPIQTALTNLDNGGTGYGTLQLNKGIYLVNGPLQTSVGGGGVGTRNGVLLLPNNKLQNGYTQQTGFRIKGVFSGPWNPTTTNYASPNQGITGGLSCCIAQGTVILCGTPGTGSGPAIMDANLNSSFGGDTYCNASVEDIDFRVPIDSNLWGFNALNGDGVCLNNVCADIDQPYDIADIPAVGTNVGIALPNYNNVNYVRCSNLDVFGYGTGIIAQEWANITNGVIMACNAGLSVAENPRVEGLLIQNNLHNIQTYGTYNASVIGEVTLNHGQGGVFFAPTCDDFDAYTTGGHFAGGPLVVDNGNFGSTPYNMLLGDPNYQNGMTIKFSTDGELGLIAPFVYNPENPVGRVNFYPGGNGVSVPGRPGFWGNVFMDSTNTSTIDAIVGMENSTTLDLYVNYNGLQITSSNIIDSLPFNGITSTGGLNVSSGFTQIHGAFNIYGNILDFASANTGVQGQTSGGTAQGGVVGETYPIAVAQGSAISLTTSGTVYNVTSRALTPGYWWVAFHPNFKLSGATVTAWQAGISATSATMETDGGEATSCMQTSTYTGNNSLSTIGEFITVPTGGETIYAVEAATFSAGTVSGYGTLECERYY